MEKRTIKDILFFFFLGAILIVAILLISNKPLNVINSHVIENVEVPKEQFDSVDFAMNPEQILKIKENIFNLMNFEREKEDISALNRNPLMDAVAQEYSNRMLRNGFFSHNDAEGKDVYDRLAEKEIFYWDAAENLYFGEIYSSYTNISEEVISDWLKSPVNRIHIIDTNNPPSFSDVGIGLSCEKLNGNEFYSCYAVAVFAGINFNYINQDLKNGYVNSIKLYPEDFDINYKTKAIVEFDSSKPAKLVVTSDPNDYNRLSGGRQLNGEDIWTFSSVKDFQEKFTLKPGYTLLIYAQAGDINYNVSIIYNA